MQTQNGCTCKDVIKKENCVKHRREKNGRHQKRKW